MTRGLPLVGLLVALLGAGCARPRPVFAPGHLTGCSVPSFRLDVGEQKTVQLHCEAKVRDSVDPWMRSYRARGYRESGARTIETFCGDVFSVTFQRKEIYLEIVGGPALIGDCGARRQYAARIQRSRRNGRPERWRIEMPLQPSDFLLHESPGPYGVKSRVRRNARPE